MSKSGNRSGLKLPDGRSTEDEHDDAGAHLRKTFAKCSDFQRLAWSSEVVIMIYHLLAG